MSRRLIPSLIWLCLAVSITCAQTTNAARQAQDSQSSPPKAQTAARLPADPNKFAVIISGASGEEQYAKQFAEWTEKLKRALTERLEFAADHVKVLAEKPADAKSGRATAEEVRRTFEGLRGAVNPESTLFIFFIGHGSFDGKQAKFNLVGADLAAEEYSNLIGALGARRVVVFNMSSASGEFVKPLAGRGRVIITATRSGQETNATRFAENFIAALNAQDADADQNGRISVLEAFNYANRLTAEFYTRVGRLATEHALLEDNGDGLGHRGAEGGDGSLARVIYLDSLTAAQAASNVETARLLKERTRLEEEIEQVKARKSDMQEVAYWSELEKLFVELAKVNRDIKKSGR